MKEIWNICFNKYKKDWKNLWNQYKSIILPFIVGSAKYLWQLVYGFLFLIGSFIYESGKYAVNNFIIWLKKI